MSAEDSVLDLAKDLLMVDLQSILDAQDGAELAGKLLPVSFHYKPKTEAFYGLVVALKGAQAAAERFRKANLEAEKASSLHSMQEQFMGRVRERDSLEA